MLSQNCFKIVCISENQQRVTAFLGALPDDLKTIDKIIQNKSGTVVLEIVLDLASPFLNEKLKRDFKVEVISFGVSSIEKFHNYISLILGVQQSVGKIEFFRMPRSFKFNYNNKQVLVYEIIDLPDVLYHYTTAEAAIAILESKSLLFSHRDLFNDPFDTRLHEGIVKPNLDYKKIATLIKEKMGDNFELYDQKDVQAGLNNFIAKIDKAVASQRLLSLGKKPDIPSMWHHYSGAYSGVVFGFSTKDRNSEWDLFFEQGNKDIKAMLYVSQSQIYINEEAIAEYIWRHYIFSNGGESDFTNWLTNNYIIPACQEKSISWEYEQELRISIVPPDEHPEKELKKFCFPLSNPEQINNIILGNKIHPMLEFKIIKLVQEKDFKVRVQKLGGLDCHFKFKEPKELFSNV